MVLQLEVLFFKTESLKQIFDISTNINDDYKIIDVHFKKFIGCTWTRNCSGKNCIVVFNRDINNHQFIVNHQSIILNTVNCWNVCTILFLLDKLPGNDY